MFLYRRSRSVRSLSFLMAALLAIGSWWSNPMPAAAADDGKAVRWSDSKEDVRISLDGRDVFQAALTALEEGEPVSGELAGTLKALVDKKGLKMVGGRELYEMEVPERVKAELGVYADLRMFVAPEAESGSASPAGLRKAAAKSATAGETGKPSGKKESGTIQVRESVMFRPDAEALEAADDKAAETAAAETQDTDDNATELEIIAPEENLPYEITGGEQLYFMLGNGMTQDLNVSLEVGGVQAAKNVILVKPNQEALKKAATPSQIPLNILKATADKLSGAVELSGFTESKLISVNLDGLYNRYEAEASDAYAAWVAENCGVGREQ